MPKHLRKRNYLLISLALEIRKKPRIAPKVEQLSAYRIVLSIAVIAVRYGMTHGPHVVPLLLGGHAPEQSSSQSDSCCPAVQPGPGMSTALTATLDLSSSQVPVRAASQFAALQ